MTGGTNAEWDPSWFSQSYQMQCHY